MAHAPLVLFHSGQRFAAEKLVHKIESESLAALPGETLYLRQPEGTASQPEKVARAREDYCQCSIRRRNAIPYVSMVDAGTIEMMRSAGAKVVTSADLVQKYEACWSKEQLDSHMAAGIAIDRIVAKPFACGANPSARKSL